jgi:hypothetical protein
MELYTKARASLKFRKRSDLWVVQPTLVISC